MKLTVMTSLKSNCVTCKTRNCSILKECDTGTLRAISSYKVSRSIRKGEKLFSEGDPVQGVYFIKSGILKVELNGKRGRPLILQISGAGSVFGHRASPMHPNHPCTVTAASDCCYCYIPASAFRTIVEKSSNLHRQLINQYLVELENAEKKSVNLAHMTVREKVAEAILKFAEVYDYERNHRSFRIHFCRQDIADLSGTTKEQVSKTLNDFEKEEIIKCTAKKFTWLNVNELLRISNLHASMSHER